MEGMLFIPIILGTNREGRMSEKVAKFVVSEIEKRDDIETQLFDVRDFKFPESGYGQSIKGKFPEYTSAVEKADGVLFVVPEYNHGYPGTIKSVLDTLFPEYKHKAAGIVGVSGGPWGGVRAIENLIPVLVACGMSVAIPSLNFPNVGEQFNEDGSVKDGVFYERTKAFLDELAWVARTLKWGRENLDK